MRYLFLHQSFPGQFHKIIKALASDPTNEVVFICQNRHMESIPGVKCFQFQSEMPNPKGHHYVYSLQNAVVQGQAVYQVAATLKEQGFYPEVIVGHSGWGCNLYMKDLFPNARLVAYCEWFFRARGSDLDFDPTRPVSADLACLTRTANDSFLLDLATCDAALSPTFWQRSQFPVEYHDKIAVIHDGVDTEIHRPLQDAKLILPRIGLNLSGCSEIVTYVARGKDLYRGFPQFMETVAIILERRPQCQFVIVGSDQVAYGPSPEGFANYKEMVCSRLLLDWRRVHFTGMLNSQEYINVLQASAVHVYLTYPFVLSWSLLEAMACGCLLVASDTPPVTEVVQDGMNGLLVDLFSPAAIADAIAKALDDPGATQEIRRQARRTVLERYDIKNLLPLQIQFLQDVLLNRFPD
jgi:glycosyltransferase involved in cell wall biosynthesis